MCRHGRTYFALIASRSSRRDVPLSTSRTFTQRPFAIGQIAWVTKATAVRSKTMFGLAHRAGLPKSIMRPAPIHQTQELPRSALSAQRDGRPYVRRAQKLSNLIFGGAVGRRAPTVDADIDTVSRDRADGQHYAPAHESDEALKDQLRELSRTTAPAKTSHALHTRLRTSSRPERSRTARRIHSVLHTSASRTGPLPEPYHMFAAGGSAAAWSHS
jgi:hypothetical protein